MFVILNNHIDPLCNMIFILFWMLFKTESVISICSLQVYMFTFYILHLPYLYTLYALFVNLGIHYIEIIKLVHSEKRLEIYIQ